MHEAAPSLPGLSPVSDKALIARFDDGDMSSVGGLLALREIEARLCAVGRLAACLQDLRAPERIRHSLAEMLRFRLLMVAAGMRMATMPIPCAMTLRSSLPIGTCLSGVSAMSPNW